MLDMDVLLGVSNENKDKNSSFENYLGAKDKSSKQSAISSFSEANNTFNDFLVEWKNYISGEKDLSKSLYFLDKSDTNSRLINKALGYTLETLKSSIPSIPVLTQTQIDSYINEYENHIVNIKKEIQSLTDARQLASEQKTNLEN